MNATRTITIVCGRNGTGLFAVHEGEAYVTHLTWDEMLGEVAQLTHPKIKSSRYGMNTPEGHFERDRLSQKRMKYHRDTDVVAMQRHAMEQLLRWNVRRDGTRVLPFDQQDPEVRTAIEVLRLSKADPEWMPE